MEIASRLLVSVRSVAEAKAALAGGADLIDVKEPGNGALGRADSAVIEAIIRAVDGRAPVSAACGELGDQSPTIPCGLQFAKFGLAGWAGRDWASVLARIRLPPECRLVAVAYADWQTCSAPPADEVIAVAIERHYGAFLIDTFEKDGRTLLDHLPIESIDELSRLCHTAGVPVALAGSLGLPEITPLRDVRPDWFAVRGAACDGGRGGFLCPDRVRQLKAQLLERAPLEDSGRD